MKVREISEGGVGGGILESRFRSAVVPVGR
jgi:hypothetical protein